MSDLNYEVIQSKICRPGRLCRHCGRCMPIVDGKNFSYDEISTESIRGPLSVWDEYPEECGYTGWLFWEREIQKHAVRLIKEKIYELSLLPSDTIVDVNTSAKEKIEYYENEIKPWDKHGAQNW